MSIIVISFDGVGDKEFEELAEDSKKYPNIAKFKKQSFYVSGLKSSFVTNTQPAHTTISTGKLPNEHGIISNHRSAASTGWSRRAKYIETETIWDYAHRKGMTTAAILWPVTCGAEIRWNMPGMCIGSPFFQPKSILKYGWKLLGAVTGTTQPYLDDFATSVSCDLLRTKNPDLTLIHLIAYDAFRHKVGGESEKLDIARKSLDKNLGQILDVAGARTVLICSDHSHLDVDRTINLSKFFAAELYEQCGGSAFFRKAIKDIESHPWFGRFLTQEEMEESGYKNLTYYGIAAKKGFSFRSSSYMSDHGYPTDYEDFAVFYAVRGGNFEPGGSKSSAKDIRDVTAIILKELG